MGWDYGLSSSTDQQVNSDLQIKEQTILLRDRDAKNRNGGVQRGTEERKDNLEVKGEGRQ